MDDLERRLRDDAAAIEADISPELALRIEASLRATERARPRERTSKSAFPLWWWSSLTGVAAALIVIAILGRQSGEVSPTEPVANVVPEVVPSTQDVFPLNAEPADLTGPLEEELEKLKTDLEKARDNVERDLRRSF